MSSSAGSFSGCSALGSNRSALGIHRPLTPQERTKLRCELQRRQQQRGRLPAQRMSHHDWLRQVRRTKTTTSALHQESQIRSSVPKPLMPLGSKCIIFLGPPHHRGVAGGVAEGLGGRLGGRRDAARGAVTCVTCKQPKHVRVLSCK